LVHYHSLLIQQVGDNVAVGRGALLNNITGSFNTAIGRQALQFNNASNNVAVGRQALQNNTADNNTAVGFEAGLTLRQLEIQQ
jgi:trimeric autotransporter adhesin